MPDIIPPTATPEPKTSSPSDKSLPTYTVVMFGGPRAGKTSLLARMYDDANDVITASGLRLGIPEKETTRRLKAALRALDGLTGAVLQAEKARDDYILEAWGVESHYPGQFDVHVFEISRSTKTVPVGVIEFADLSGEDLLDASPITDEWLDAADMFLVCINTPPMMAAVADPKWSQMNRYRNGADITDRLVARARAGRPPDAVLFTPIKCERWLAEDPHGKDLRAAVKKSYMKPLQLLAGEAFKKTSVAITPVVTVGAVHFDKFVISDERAGLTSGNVVEKWKLPSGKPTGPAYYSEPFRWALHAFAGRIDYPELADAILNDRDSFMSHKVAAWLGISWRAWIESLQETFGRKNVDETDFEVGPIKKWVDDATGLPEFRNAATILYDGRMRDEPFEIIRENRAGSE